MHYLDFDLIMTYECLILEMDGGNTIPLILEHSVDLKHLGLMDATIIHFITSVCMKSLQFPRFNRDDFIIQLDSHNWL